MASTEHLGGDASRTSMAVAHLLGGVTPELDVPGLLRRAAEAFVGLDLADIAVLFVETDEGDVIVSAGAGRQPERHDTAPLVRRTRERSGGAALECSLDAAELMDALSPPATGASVSIALGAAEDAVGGMCVFRGSTAGWTHAEEDAIRVVTQITGALVVQKLPTVRAEVKVAQLQRALDERIVVEQAKGYLAARAKVTPDVAFEEMRREARRTSTKINQIARQVVAGDAVAEYLERRLGRAAPRLAQPGANSGR